MDTNVKATQHQIPKNVILLTLLLWFPQVVTSGQLPAYQIEFLSQLPLMTNGWSVLHGDTIFALCKVSGTESRVHVIDVSEPVHPLVKDKFSVDSVPVSFRNTMIGACASILGSNYSNNGLLRSRSKYVFLKNNTLYRFDALSLDPVDSTIPVCLDSTYLAFYSLAWMGPQPVGNLNDSILLINATFCTYSGCNILLMDVESTPIRIVGRIDYSPRPDCGSFVGSAPGLFSFVTSNCYATCGPDPTETYHVVDFTQSPASPTKTSTVVQYKNEWGVSAAVMDTARLFSVRMTSDSVGFAFVDIRNPEREPLANELREERRGRGGFRYTIADTTRRIAFVVFDSSISLYSYGQKSSVTQERLFSKNISCRVQILRANNSIVLAFQSVPEIPTEIQIVSLIGREIKRLPVPQGSTEVRWSFPKQGPVDGIYCAIAKRGDAILQSQPFSVTR